MQEHPHPNPHGETPGAAASALNPEQWNQIVEDFRQWIQQDIEAAQAFLAEPSAAEIDLAGLVQQFTALRHEVHLQTRASRTQSEQNNQALEQLRQAMEMLQNRSDQIDEEIEEQALSRLKPLLKGMIDAQDALRLAFRQVSRMQEQLRAITSEFEGEVRLKEWEAPEPEPSLAVAPVAPSFLARFFRVKAPLQAPSASPEQPGDPLAQEKQHLHEFYRTQAIEAIEQHREIFRRWMQSVESIVAGYGMSLQRLDRVTEQYGLEPIEALGRPFDPEVMEVVEVIQDPQRVGSEVIEVVRPGYRWNGQLFRFAQVRVARGRG